MRTVVVWMILGLASSLAAQETKTGSGKKLEQPPANVGTRAESGDAGDAGEGAERKWAQPEEPAPATGPWKVVSPGKGPVPGAAVSPADGPLKGMRALATKDGEARLLFPDGERTLRPGDRLGIDVVRSVGDGLLVLDRPPVPSRAGGGATVVVRFDAAGQPRVRVYHLEDPTPVNPPQVR